MSLHELFDLCSEHPHEVNTCGLWFPCSEEERPRIWVACHWHPESCPVTDHWLGTYYAPYSWLWWHQNKTQTRTLLKEHTSVQRCIVKRQGTVSYRHTRVLRQQRKGACPRLMAEFQGGEKSSFSVEEGTPLTSSKGWVGVIPGGKGKRSHQREACMSTRAGQQILETGALHPWTLLGQFANWAVSRSGCSVW